MAGTDILAGVTSAQDASYVTEEAVASTDEWMAKADAIWTVAASGTADGIAIKAGTDGGGPGCNVKMIVTDASGNILGTTTPTAMAESQWVVADLDSSFSVSENDEIQLWFCFDAAYFNVMSDGASWVACSDTAGSYASPPDPLDDSGTVGEGIFALRLMGTEGGGPNITDVNTTESWDDGDTGIVITGTGFV